MTGRCVIERLGFAIDRSTMDAAAFVADDGRIELRYRINSTPISRLAHRQVEATLRDLEREAHEILAAERDERSTNADKSAEE